MSESLCGIDNTHLSDFISTKICYEYISTKICHEYIFTKICISTKICRECQSLLKEREDTTDVYVICAMLISLCEPTTLM